MEYLYGYSIRFAHCEKQLSAIAKLGATRNFQKMPKCKRPFDYSIYLRPKSGFKPFGTQTSILEVHNSVCIGM